MKVCTDACLLGAWVAAKLETKEITAENILDIGCGTGLLSLMLAQKTEANIDAVELNENAFLQAKENIALSLWEKRIKIFNENIIDYNAKKKYDLIICNPPFFQNQLKSIDVNRNAAMHGTQLSFTVLATTVKNNLKNDGIAAILLPHNIVNEFSAIFKKEGFFVNEQLNVSHSSSHPFFRAVLLFSFIQTDKIENSMAIKNLNNEYSTYFKKLLEDYYLHL